MEAKELRELIEMISRSNFATFELERDGFKLKLVKGETAQPAPVATVLAPAAPAAPPAPVAAQEAVQASAAPAPPPAAPVPAPGLTDLTSPIVGTFYRAPSPEADPFAEVGQKVSKGKILCIIESMKLMNEIESDVEGTIVKIYPQNGQPIEYGENLFAVRV